MSVLLYHLVCSIKYRREVFLDGVSKELESICKEITYRYEIAFIEIGTDGDHVHFLIQSVPTYSPSKICRVVKSLTAREIFKRVPGIKEKLWGGEFWTDGYFMGTVGQHGNEETIRSYVKAQGGKSNYKKIHREQLRLF